MLAASYADSVDPIAKAILEDSARAREFFAHEMSALEFEPANYHEHIM